MRTKFRQLCRLVKDRSYRRDVLWLYLLQPKGTFQPHKNTSRDRYPQIFRFVQSRLGAESQVRILSFGCSTGEEVLTLRDYFPRAFIKGIDINPANIAICRERLRRNPDCRVEYECNRSTKSEPSGSYDAIFCMAVLRHGELGRLNLAKCDKHIRFADVATTVMDFKRCLKPDGLLVMRHNNFRLCDMPAGSGFQSVMSLEIQKGEKQPLFGPDNRLMVGNEYPDTVFQKNDLAEI